MTSNFYSAIHKNLSNNPNKEFLKWSNQGQSNSTFSGQVILNKVASVGNSLQQKNLKEEEKVVIGIPFSPDFIFAVLGVMAYGAIPVLPPVAGTRVSLLRLLHREKIKGVYSNIPTGIRLLLVIFGIKIICPVSGNKDLPNFQPREVAQDQAALISFSSGSTGKPKAVYRTHKILQSQHLALKESFPPVPNQNDFPLFPNILLHNLALGITTIIPDIPKLDVRQLEPERLLKQILNEKVDSLTGNVFYFKKLLNYLQQNDVLLPDVKELGIGGSPVPEYLPHLLKQYFINATIYLIYGSTQAEPIAIREVKERKEPALGYFVGTIHPDISLRLTSSEKIKARSKIYSAGHIEVKGKHVVLQKDEEWLKTGDYGYLNENGELFLTGRQGNNTLIQGYSHYQIENLLTTLTDAKQVAAIANKDSFDIYYEGDVDPEKIRKILEVFPQSVFNLIKPIEKMPMDNRHHSKILYQKLCTQNLKM
ncbi:AMP-binding protein [Autumnicola psychrophila]|uniref:AMP-binding protein n=1 Tax=Autumnicola psychrophila TaxID=3075592 RepID=A0ABU3DME7_9FLAO|nr:AMP-binding protein [Zunongwangia sp. F225]MDT0684889.1 AMP-binding protein [Zunongwangia sp. F225]